MNMEEANCKYCLCPVRDVTAEGIQCEKCELYVHMLCLRRGTVPGGLTGDVFFTYVCVECSEDGSEIFVRDKMPWFQAIVLILYHISLKHPGLARRGYFHWKIHLANIIDQHWDILFPSDFRRKKNWIGTIAGALSTYSPYFFYSGTPIFSEQGWWTLTFPKLTPNAIIKINTEFHQKKLKAKETCSMVPDFDLLRELIQSKDYEIEYQYCVADHIETVIDIKEEVLQVPSLEVPTYKKEIKSGKNERNQKKTLLPTLETYNEGNPKKLFKTNTGLSRNSSNDSLVENVEETEKVSVANNEPVKFTDPMCHYNTSLNNISNYKGMLIRAKLLGGLREETLFSPYSSLYLKPYIRRDVSNTPVWLKLMVQILLKTNGKHPDYVLPPRGSIDYAYVQPSHIPAINSLCNQFFWPGIDLTETLQYPDFSCVVLYRKLIVGFAFVVPDVKFHENYISFIFVRPGWRDVGIARFMIYHLIQTSTGKDLTLHVSINNPALFLYQKFGFKVEHVELNFYDKYYTKDSKESKHAFFCRLERR